VGVCSRRARLWPIPLRGAAARPPLLFSVPPFSAGGELCICPGPRAPQPLGGGRGGPAMDTDILKHRLALVERQIIDEELHVTLRGDIVARLEADGLGASETADITRDLLRQIEKRLQVHT